MNVDRAIEYVEQQLKMLRGDDPVWLFANYQTSFVEFAWLDRQDDTVDWIALNRDVFDDIAIEMFDKQFEQYNALYVLVQPDNAAVFIQQIDDPEIRGWIQSGDAEVVDCNDVPMYVEVD